ncbi:FMN-binding negative transcriptional regulator [Alsobacter sp. SYSU M60028]|uniref:FMN-binding negative transcriptional regulator n=1 Tax=Alsobacter ponti TaxID=2962936 RepID=A0ABT1LGG8_9HYPH|nr:FMN-binding negative transcriptional regulator [Alsobacter ponti]MCP8939815.1 FMN-binding negative transcriptional regulator [Alsobacter ponti]
MYQPPLFRETDRERQHALIRENPFGLFVTAGAGGLIANGIPFVLDADGPGPGVLRGHVARANPQWRDCVGGCPALVVFQGPEHYVTPSWYATKAETGKVVPTWNYAMAQARGTARAIEDPAWLHAQIRALTGQMEGSRAAPWAVDDAPADFLAGQVKGIVGIEIALEALDGKWKVSQNRPEADRAGVVAGLGEIGTDAAAAMAALVAKGRTGA